MRAMILAAGRGERMREYTARTPKPLLRVNDHYLIEYSLAHLVRAGIKEVVINVSYHADQIKSAIGDGKKYGLSILYSEEEERLETGGGILKALPLLGKDPFLVLSSDIITDYPMQNLPKHLDGLAHLVLVDNPSFHPYGDFGLHGKWIDMLASPARTFANIGVYSPELFRHSQPGRFPLSQLLFPAIRKQQITGEYYQGTWYNVGTPEELAVADQFARENSHLRLLTPQK